MSDRDRMKTSPEHPLATALRALPESAPQPDLWPDLAQALAMRRRRRPWRYALPAALAAGIALVALIPQRVTQPGSAPVAPSRVTTTAPTATQPATDELSNLHQRSQTLERWLAAATRSPQDGRDLMAAVELEDMIGLVDVQLGATRGEADALPLWRQRVALLEDLATIRGSAYTLAANRQHATATL